MRTRTHTRNYRLTKKEHIKVGRTKNNSPIPSTSRTPNDTILTLGAFRAKCIHRKGSPGLLWRLEDTRTRVRLFRPLMTKSSQPQALNSLISFRR